MQAFISLLHLRSWACWAALASQLFVHPEAAYMQAFISLLHLRSRGAGSQEAGNSIGRVHESSPVLLAGCALGSEAWGRLLQTPPGWHRPSAQDSSQFTGQHVERAERLWLGQ